MARTRIEPFQGGVPAGGSTGKVLTKASGADYDVDWETPSGGASSKGCLICLCIAFTPSGTGADIGEVVVPYDPADGTTPVTWNVRRITLRANTPGGAPVVVIQKSTVGNAAFGAGTTVGTITFGSGDYEGSVTTSLGTVDSNDKLRFSVTTLGSATGWTIEVLLGL